MITESYGSIRVLRVVASLFASMTSVGRGHLVSRLGEIIHTVKQFQNSLSSNDELGLISSRKEFEVQSQMLFSRLFMGVDDQMDQTLMERMSGVFQTEMLMLDQKEPSSLTNEERAKLNRELSELLGLLSGLIKALEPRDFAKTATIAKAIEKTTRPRITTAKKAPRSKAR
jgi:hypothetical protein